MDGGYSSDQTDEAIRKLDEVTELLCELCKKLEIIIMIDRSTLFSPDLKAWWATHKAADAQRQKDLEKASQKEQDKETALNRLSQHERKLLGL